MQGSAPLKTLASKKCSMSSKMYFNLYKMPHSTLQLDSFNVQHKSLPEKKLGLVVKKNQYFSTIE